MHKKSLWILVIVLMVLIHSFCFAVENLQYENENTGYVALIEDDANLIKEKKRESLLLKMKSLTQYGNIIFKSITSNNMGSTKKYASQYYHSKFGKESGTIFLIDMQERYIWIFSDGENYTMIRTSGANAIADNVYKFASEGDYYTCAFESYNQMEKLLEDGQIYAPMKYINNMLLALTISLFINLILVVEISKIKKIKNKDLLSNIQHFLKINEINFIKTHLTKTYSPTSSGSSSGGSSYSGGGSSGGGGGHRF